MPRKRKVQIHFSKMVVPFKFMGKDHRLCACIQDNEEWYWISTDPDDEYLCGYEPPRHLVPAKITAAE